MSLFDHEAVERLAIGAGILGTGGGGNPYLGKIHAQKHVAQGAQIKLVSLADVPDDAHVVSVGGMGSPTVGIERLPRGDECLLAVRALERHLGVRCTHLIAAEIGGSNAMAPLTVAALAGLPVIDADGMGRAFPELQMDTYMIYGLPPTPAAFADPFGQTMVLEGIRDPHTLERYARAVTIQMGGASGGANVFSGADAKRTAIPGTYSLAIAMGGAVLDARRSSTDPIDAALSVSGGVRLFTGKIVDVARRMEGGFARGVLRLSGTGVDSGQELRLDFQNENLIARTVDGRVLAVVPDLICVVDADTAEPITTEVVRYGLRVAVLGIPAPALMKTPEALAVVGPAAFGYADVPYLPISGAYGAG